MRMNGDVLLDTSAVIQLIAEDPLAVGLVASNPGIYVSFITLGELLYGAEKSERPQENIADIKTFTSAFSLLPCDKETAGHYGYLANVLRKKGRPIPQNDIWIAAVARQHDLIVATWDKHFQQVPEISVYSW